MGSITLDIGFALSAVATIIVTVVGSVSTATFAIARMLRRMDEDRRAERAAADAARQAERAAVDADRQAERAAVDADRQAERAAVDADRQAERAAVDADRRAFQAAMDDFRKEMQRLAERQTRIEGAAAD